MRIGADAVPRIEARHLTFKFLECALKVSLGCLIVREYVKTPCWLTARDNPCDTARFGEDRHSLLTLENEIRRFAVVQLPQRTSDKFIFCCRRFGQYLIDFCPLLSSPKIIFAFARFSFEIRHVSS
jgi:hypothetical protein